MAKLRSRHTILLQQMTDSPENTASRRLSDEARTTSKVVERNVRALVELAAEQERARSTGDRIASAVSGFAGSMKFVYFHAVAFGLWLAMENGWIPTIGGYHLTFGATHKLIINEWWGRVADFPAIAATDPLPSVKLDFREWMTDV